MFNKSCHSPPKQCLQKACWRDGTPQQGVPKVCIKEATGAKYCTISTLSTVTKGIISTMSEWRHWDQTMSSQAGRPHSPFCSTPAAALCA